MEPANGGSDTFDRPRLNITDRKYPGMLDSVPAGRRPSDNARRLTSSPASTNPFGLCLEHPRSHACWAQRRASGTHWMWDVDANRLSRCSATPGLEVPLPRSSCICSRLTVIPNGSSMRVRRYTDMEPERLSARPACERDPRIVRGTRRLDPQSGTTYNADFIVSHRILLGQWWHSGCHSLCTERAPADRPTVVGTRGNATERALSFSPSWSWSVKGIPRQSTLSTTRGSTIRGPNFLASAWARKPGHAH